MKQFTKKQLIIKIFLLVLFFIFYIIPQRVFAHEVYVLDEEEIQYAIQNPSPNPIQAIYRYEQLFILWAVVTITLLACAYLSSLSDRLRRHLNLLLKKLKFYAPLIGRITLGASLIVSGLYGALFGPEFPLIKLFGQTTIPIQFLLLFFGLLIILGLKTRWASFGTFLIFLFAFIQNGFIMIMYLSYLGKILLLIILGEHLYSLHTLVKIKEKSKYTFLTKLYTALEQYSFFILRISFGITLVFSSFYAKFLHSNLALQTIEKHHLTQFFPYDPLFVVLGAWLIESLIGILFILGFQIRFTAIIFMFFITLSVLYFGEAVWPHIILYGTNLALFAHGYDKYTIGGKYFTKNGIEPVL